MEGDELQLASHRRRIQVVIAAITAVLCQLSTIFSSMSASKERAQWTDPEALALLDYLIEHKGEAGDGVNFKSKTFNDAVPFVAPFFVRGPAKTGAMLKTKYSGVRFNLSSGQKQLIYFNLQIRGTYNLINTWRNLSGVHWDNVTGASITTEAECKVWDAFVNVKVSALDIS